MDYSLEIAYKGSMGHDLFFEYKGWHGKSGLVLGNWRRHDHLGTGVW